MTTIQGDGQKMKSLRFASGAYVRRTPRYNRIIDTNMNNMVRDKYSPILSLSSDQIIRIKKKIQTICTFNAFNFIYLAIQISCNFVGQYLLVKLGYGFFK